MKSKHILLILLVILLVSACQTTPPRVVMTSTQSESEPVEPTSTSTPTATVTITPTSIPPTASPTTTSTPTPIEVGPDNFPDGVNPLTGLPVADETQLERRPLGIKVQMFPRNGRPPWGVSLADIVYDFFQNDGLTRLHAIFYGENADLVGPVRSARLFDGQITQMYKSVFAFGGAAKQVLNAFYYSNFADRLIFEGKNACPPMCRIDPNGFNYLVISDTVNLSDYATNLGIENGIQNLSGMRFEQKIPDGGKAGESVTTRYSISAYNRWDYDLDSGRYLRWQDTQEDQGEGEAFAKLLDRLTGNHIGVENVVFLYLVHNINPPFSRTVVEIQMVGKGKALIFRDGQAYEVEWYRPTSDAVVSLILPDGTPFPYKPGKTWYQVIGQSSQVEEKGDGSWRFTFNIP